jgi:hypothetical protein
MPDPDYAGLGIFDFEAWTPIWQVRAAHSLCPLPLSLYSLSRDGDVWQHGKHRSKTLISSNCTFQAATCLSEQTAMRVGVSSPRLVGWVYCSRFAMYCVCCTSKYYR